MRLQKLTALAALLALAGPSAAAAQSGGTDNKLREALRSTTSQLRALEGERATWEAKQAELERRVTALEADLAKARRQAGKGGARADELRKAEGSAKELGDALATCEAGKKTAEEALAAAQAAREEAGSRAKAADERLGEEQARSGRLLAAGREILKQLEKIGSDPVFGLRGVSIENAAQDLEDKLVAEGVSR